MGNVNDHHPIPKGIVRLVARWQMVRMALQSQKRPRPQITRAHLSRTRKGEGEGGEVSQGRAEKGRMGEGQTG